MRKKIIRNLAIINCLLMTLPGLASAAENVEPVDANAIEEVVVNAVPLDKYLVTTGVITAKEIEAKGAKDLSQVLSDMPGVQVRYGGRKGSASIEIRGMGMSYTKIYIDGVLMNPLGKLAGGEVDLNMFPVDNIAKIEVIKGPAPVSYGSDAVGGIILITTKNGDAIKGGKVSLSGGSDSTRNASVSYGDGDKKFNYYVNAGTEHTDGFRDNGDRKTEYFNTKLNWKVKEDAQLTFSGSYSNTDRGCLNPLDPETGNLVYTTTGWWKGLLNWQFRDWEKTSLNLSYAEKTSDKFDFNVKLYRFTEDQGLWADGRLASRTVVTPAQWAQGYVPGTASNDSGYSLRRWNASYWESSLNGLELQGNLKLSDKHTLTFGSLYNDAHWKKSVSNNPVSDPYNPNAYHWSEYNNKRDSYYLQDNFTPNEKLMITFGLRYDKSETEDQQLRSTKTMSDTNPTFNVVYTPNDNNTFRASYGKTISFPTINQLYGIYGDSGLKPEQSENYELGWKHRFDETVTGDIAVFRNDVTDLIDTITVGGNRITTNIREAKIRGIELEVNKKFTNRTDGFLNYTLLDTNGEMVVNSVSSNNDLKSIPAHTINYGLSYKADKGYKFSLAGHIVSTRATWDEQMFGTNGRSNDTRSQNTTCYPRIGAYHTVDFQIKREIDENRDWYINVYNIFDTDYEAELFSPAAGRTFIAGVNFKF